MAVYMYYCTKHCIQASLVNPLFCNAGCGLPQGWSHSHSSSSCSRGYCPSIGHKNPRTVPLRFFPQGWRESLVDSPLEKTVPLEAFPLYSHSVSFSFSPGSGKGGYQHSRTPNITILKSLASYI